MTHCTECRHEGRRGVHVGTCVVVWKMNEILMLLRKGSHGAGTWSVPGGWIDRGEGSTAEAALREFHEEVGGVEIGTPTYYGLTNDVFPDEDIHCMTLWYHAPYINGVAKVLEPDKAQIVGWCDIHRLPQPIFFPMQNYLKGNIVK